MGIFSQEDKVNWCSAQVDKIARRTQKLGVNQSLPVSKAIRDLSWAAGFFGKTIDSDLGVKVSELGRNNQ